MKWSKQFIRFVIIFLLQILLINNLHISGLCHPYLYIVCLLIMPITLPNWAELIIGALVGLIMDAFCNSPGIHMAACTLLMLIRPYLIGRMVADSERLTDEIDLSTMSTMSFFIYATVLIVTHHVMVFVLTNWFHGWLFTIGQIIISSAITLGLVFGYLFIKKK